MAADSSGQQQTEAIAPASQASDLDFNLPFDSVNSPALPSIDSENDLSVGLPLSARFQRNLLLTTCPERHRLRARPHERPVRSCPSFHTSSFATLTPCGQDLDRVLTIEHLRAHPGEWPDVPPVQAGQWVTSFARSS